MPAGEAARPAARETRGRGRPRAFDRARALERALAVFWKKGYAPASVADLCQAMEIRPPSLYATFGSKAELFLETLAHYERAYWDGPSARFLAEPDVRRAVADFFAEAARILASPDTPCGCMVVLAAVNIAEEEREIRATVHRLRQATQQMFEDRLARAQDEGQLPADCDVRTCACALNTLLEGLSLQVRDGMDEAALGAVAALAVRLLPQS
ncbi:MAG: TetR/AcrR family transcriptional regulator [Desulfovibrionaceae bacterium]|nr:TetR/AcrR family transcriptional regulator [Desulfovibrionaceae bacterium]